MMRWAERQAAGEVIATARAMRTSGLVVGTSGNVSARVGDAVLITPSGMDYDALTPDDLCALGVGGREAGAARGRRKPSSEAPMHLAIYAARREVEAIVHTHSTAATALACLGKGIPAFHYMVAAAGGADIRCAPYATFGSAALAAHALAALDGRRACLLANHGMIALGSTLAGALALAREVENLAEQYLRTLAVGQPNLLDDAEMARVIAKFASYGQHKGP